MKGRVLVSIILLTLAQCQKGGANDASLNEQGSQVLMPIDDVISPTYVALDDEISLFSTKKFSRSKVFFEKIDEIGDNDSEDENNDSDLSNSITNTSSPNNTNEPPISIAQLQQIVGNCKLPNLSLKNKVITSNLEYRIFVYCFLDILSPKKYPKINRVKHKASTLLFMALATKKALHIHVNDDANLSHTQKLALFERVFIATKFRVLTANEKLAVEVLIANVGLKKATRIFLCNWYFSSFYQNNFDYSKDPQPAYESAKLWGFIQDESDSDLDAVKYSIAANTLKGFVTEGISTNQSRSKKHLEYSNDYADGKIKHSIFSSKKFSYNFFIQFYVEKNLLKKKRKSQNHHKSKKKKNSHHDNDNDRYHKDHKKKNKQDHHYGKKKFNEIDVPIMLSKSGYQSNITLISIKKLYTRDSKIILKEENLQPNPSEPFWPQVNYTSHPLLSQIDFTTITSGQYLGCQRPSLNNNLINTREWKEYIICILPILGMNSFSKEIINDFVFYSKKVTLSFLLGQIESLTQASFRLNHSDTEVTNVLFAIITGRSLTTSEVSLINESLLDIDLASLMTSIIGEWYLSASSNVFDFDNTLNIEKKKYSVYGSVKNNNEQPLSGVLIEVYSQDNNKVEEVYSSNDGSFQIDFLSSTISASSKYRIAFSSAGLGNKNINWYIGSLQNMRINAILNPLNVISQKAGGEIHSADALIKVEVFPNSTKFNGQVSISNLEPGTVSGFGAVPQLRFSTSHDMKFSRNALIEIKLPQGQLDSSPNKNNWHLLVKEFDKAGKAYWKLIYATYDQQNKKIIAYLPHFSEFLIATVELDCRLELNITKCTRLLDNQYPLHPLGKLVDNSFRIMDFPQGIPSLMIEANNYLVANEFNALPNDLSTLLSLSNFPFELPSNCFSSAGCASLDITPNNLSTLSTQIGIDITQANIHMNSKLNMHVEECAVNKKAVMPKLRVNEVSEINAGGTISFQKNTNLSYRCISKSPRRKCYGYNTLFGFVGYCSNYYDQYINCSSQMTMIGSAGAQNLRQRISRTQDNKNIVFAPTGSFSPGTITVNSISKTYGDTLTHPSGSARFYNTLSRTSKASAIEVGLKLSLQAESGSVNTANIIAYNITSAVNKANFTDPSFSATNCKASNNSTTRVLDQFQLALGKNARANVMTVLPNGHMFTIGIASDAEDIQRLILRKSTTSGSSWQNVPIFTNEVACSSKDNLGAAITSDVLGNIYIYNICEKSFVAGSASEIGIVIKSSNDGETFTILGNIKQGLPTNTISSNIIQMIAKGNDLFVIGYSRVDIGATYTEQSSFVRKSVDGGDNWVTVQYNEASENTSYYGAAIASNSTSVFNVVSVERRLDPSKVERFWRVNRSDAGGSFQLVDEYQYLPNGSTVVKTLAVKGSEVFVAGTAPQAIGDRRWLVRRSVDNGSTWQMVDDEPAGDLSDDNGPYSSGFDHYGNYWVSGVTLNVVDPNIPIIQKIYNGMSWHRIDASQDPNFNFFPLSYVKGFNNTRSFTAGMGFAIVNGLPSLDQIFWDVREITNNVFGSVIP